MNDPHHGLPQAGIIGSGIAGLCAAIALRRAGWSCELFERSSFAHEIGAAISVTPNATRCLAHWGFDFAKARPVQNQQLRFMMAKDLDVVFRSEYANLEERFGYPAWSFHRVDLHRGLRDVALREQGAGVPAIVRLGCRVEGVDFETGRIVLANGESVKKDLVIVADGAHVSLNTYFPVFTDRTPELNRRADDRQFQPSRTNRAVDLSLPDSNARSHVRS
jgi:salicylate hydroxylase